MENILHKVNRHFISLPEEEIQRNDKILKHVFDVIVENMKSVDKLFEALYRRPFYGGSYYDGLFVKTANKPYDYDLDLLLSIPKKASPVLLPSNIPGHIQLKVQNVSWFETLPVYAKFKKKFLDGDNYLVTHKALEWMESVVQRSFNLLPWSASGKYYYLEVGFETFPITFSKSGPAVTLHIDVGSDCTLDVDLVISFVFTEDKWPQGFSPNPYEKFISWLGPTTVLNEFFIVAKKPKNISDYEYEYTFLERHWRLSFQEQERKLIADKGRLKPVGRLLKKMKNRQQHDKIASYYIKTVLLFMVEKRNDDFWQQSLSHVFMDALETYTKFIRDKEIPYYWNKDYNLIDHIDDSTLNNFAYRLEHIIKDIKKNQDKPDTVVKYLLNDRELEEFYRENLDKPENQSSCIIT
jgi:hypothetical protein